MPFQITTQSFGPLPNSTHSLTEYLLEHTESGEFIAVIPEFGGILRRLVLRKGKKLFALLQAPDSPQGLMADESYASALLFPFPSRIRHGIYRFDGEAYTLKMNEVKRDNAIHGFVHGRAFSVVDQDVTSTHAQLTLRYDYMGDTVGYPFPFTLTVVYELVQANLLPHGSNPEADKMCALRVTYSVQNIGVTRCPVAFGWHPYFTFTGEPVDHLSITLPNRTPIALDENMIPDGLKPYEEAGTLNLHKQELDSAFLIEPTSGPDAPEPFAETILTSLSTGVRMIVGQQTGEGKFNYLVCYTPTRRDSIAIEPLTANVDAFNNSEGLTVLEPWDSITGTMWVRLD